MKRHIKLGLDEVLSLIKKGLSPAKISKKYNIPKQTLSYTVSKLKRFGCIEKKGYGTWEYIKEVQKVPKDSRKAQTSDFLKKEIRGHAFIWKIEFMRPYYWEIIIKNYRKRKLTFRLICQNRILRTIFNNRKIWFTKKGLTIYEPLDFFGKSSFEVKGTAVFEMDKLIKGLLKELNIGFQPYRFTTSREHYGMIKNELARQYNDKKEKLIIRGEEGNVWLWIDDSESLGELETNELNTSRQVQNFWNNHKKHKFRIDADFIIKRINDVTQNQQLFAQNIETHIKAIQDLGEGVKIFTNKLDEFTELVKKKKQPTIK